MLSLSGHIGAKASALVDGQLAPAEEERAWSHVLSCPGCRGLVEHEGWTKRQLGALSGPAPSSAPDHVLGSLFKVDARLTGRDAERLAWAEVGVIERRSTRRRAAAVAVGGSAIGACALALLTATGNPVGSSPRPAPANVSGGVFLPASTVRPFGADAGGATGAETTRWAGFGGRTR